MRIVCGLMLILALAGCNREAERQRILAVQKFKTALAAMQVCTKDSTYAEFRQRRIELEACYLAEKNVLQGIPVVQALFPNLLDEMKATEHCWRLYREYDEVKLRTEGEDWEAMLIISPGLKNESAEQAKLRKAKPAYAITYAKAGLSCVNASCGVILNRIDQKELKK
jgi:hypothetical protein